MLTLAALVAAALGLAAQEPPAPLAEADFDRLDDCAADYESRAEERQGWSVIDARAMTSPVALHAALLRALPEGKRIVILGGEFPKADMRVVADRLANACLVDMNLEGSNWEATQIPQLQLVRTSLREAKLARARWPGLRTRGMDIEGADFSRADLSGLRFVSAYSGAGFGSTSFAGANLRDASFACGITVDEWCINATPDLTGADLTGADLSGLGLWDAAMHEGAVIDNTTIAPRSLPRLGGARIIGPVRLANYFTPTYESEDEGEGGGERLRVDITPDEARSLIAASLSVASPPDRPSFDCAKAGTPVEKLICGQYAEYLRSLDRDLAAVWGEVRAAGKGDLAAQRRWLAARGQCKDETCLVDRYEARLAQLRGLLGPGITLKPGETVSYHTDLLPLPEAARHGALYARIIPVLIDGSYQRVTLTGGKDGTIDAVGDAIGGNAHMCDLNALGLRFDPASGWWSLRGAEGAMLPLLRLDGRRIHFRYSGNLGDTPEEVGDVISCGARAAFDSGIDLSPRPD